MFAKTISGCDRHTSLIQQQVGKGFTAVTVRHGHPGIKGSSRDKGVPADFFRGVDEGVAPFLIAVNDFRNGRVPPRIPQRINCRFLQCWEKADKQVVLD